MVKKVKVKYIGSYYKVVLEKNKIYDVLDIKNGMYKLNTELGENETAYFSIEEFEIVS